MSCFPAVFFFHPNKNAELIITIIEPALCTRAPATGFNIPVMARIIATIFNVMEKVRLKFLKNVLIVMAAVRLMYVMTAANQSVKNMIYVEIAIPNGRKIE